MWQTLDGVGQNTAQNRDIYSSLLRHTYVKYRLLYRLWWWWSLNGRFNACLDEVIKLPLISKGKGNSELRLDIDHSICLTQLKNSSAVDSPKRCVLPKTYPVWQWILSWGSWIRFIDAKYVYIQFRMIVRYVRLFLANIEGLSMRRWKARGDWKSCSG